MVLVGTVLVGTEATLDFQICVYLLHLSIPYSFFKCFFMVLLSVNAVYILVAGFYAVIRLYIL